MAEKPEATKAASMPQPTEQHKKLHLLAGEWEGEETLSPSPWGPGGAAFGRYSGRVAMDGFYVVQDYVEEKDGRTVFRGHGVFGWDAERAAYAWYWFDSMGQVPPQPSFGRWEGDALIFESTSPQGRGRYSFRFASPDQYSFKLENSFDGGATYATLMEGNYRRKK
jgi:hypothetical protein